MLIGKELEMLLKRDGRSSVSIKKDFFASYEQSLKYLEKWFRFSDSSCSYKIKFLSPREERIWT
jgi:hypothetical protein